MEIGATLSSRYTLTAELGKGAMGVVYRATDAQIGQPVAVKVIARDLALDPEMLERFRREGEALRQLRHPNIVGFVDMFQFEGQQVIVMEFAPGGNLRDLLKREGPLPFERARQITLDLCDALIRAHRLNIIHRDLKPENVLLAEDGLPRLTDFGVARLTNKSTYLTATGVQVGTPLYMSPEAWEGKPLDAQTDIWSLGVMLYEMLSGSVPFSGDTVVTVMNKVLTQPVPDLKAVRRDVPDSLAQIVRRMLTRDKSQRYATARQVSADLEACCFDGGTVVPERRLTATKKLVLKKRYALWIGAATVLVVASCGGAAFAAGRLVWPNLAGGPGLPAATAPGSTPAQPTARATNTPRPSAPPTTAPGASVAETSAPVPAQATTAAPPVSPVSAAAGLPAAAPITAASAASLSQVSFGKILASPVDLALSPDGKTLFVASHFNLGAYDLGNLDQPRYEVQGTQDVTCMALSPDGSRLAIGNYFGVITLWDMTNGGSKINDLKGHTEAIAGVAFSPDGKLLASAGGRDKSVRVWDLSTGKELFTSADAQAEVGSVAFSPDGATLAVGSNDKKIRLWDVPTRKMKLELDSQSGDVGNVDSLVFSPDGKLLVSAGQYDAAIHVWDTQTWKAAALLHGSSMADSSYGYYSLAFNPAGTLLAAGGHDATVRLWDMDAASPTHNKELAALLRHSDWVTRVAFTPDGGTLISASARDGTVRVWQAGAGASAGASPTSETVAVISTAVTVTAGAPAGTEITAANAASLGEALFVKKMGSPTDMALSPDGNTLVVTFDFSLATYDFGNFDTPRYKLSGSAGQLALSQDGTLLATADSGGPITLWDLSRGGVKVAVLKGHSETVTDVAFSPDGSLLASAGGRDKSMHLWDVKAAKELFVDAQPQAEVDSVAFSPDGATLAVGYSDTKIRLWDVKAMTTNPNTKATLELDAQSGYPGYVNSLAFSPDGKQLVSTGQYDPDIHVWDTQTWKSTLVLHASNPKDTHTGFYSLAFNRAGTLLAAGGGDSAVRVWDMEAASATFGKELVVLQRHSDWVTSVLFTPDGTTLMSASARDGTVRLWQVGAGK